MKLRSPLLQAIIGGPLSSGSGSRVPCRPRPICASEPTAPLLAGTSGLLAITLAIRDGDVRDHTVADRAGEARDLGLQRTDRSPDLGDRGGYPVALLSEFNNPLSSGASIL